MTATLEREALVLHGYAPSVLDRIRDKAVELAVWERELPHDFAQWLDALPPENLPDARGVTDDAGLESMIAAMLDDARTPQGAMRDMLLDDIAGLGRRFMAIMNSAQVDIRLESIDHDACWKFHRDCVEARLLATYRGPGAQWVPPALDNAALDRQSDYRGPLPSLSRFAAGMFKGSCAAPASGIVHRSPPIDGAGITRLLLCLNLPRPAHH